MFKFKISYLFLILFSLCFDACSDQFVSTSEYTVYRGQIILNQPNNIIMGKINIIGDDLGSLFDKTGKLRPYLPRHPDSAGYFTIIGTTLEHANGITPNHWETGPKEILYYGDSIQTRHDTISVEILKSLQKISFDSANIPNGSKLLGVWLLPNVTIISK